MMFEKIIRAPINKFFDVTPFNRIMRYFSEDLEAFDHGFINAADEIVHCIQMTIFTFVKILYSVPMLLVFAPFFWWTGKRKSAYCKNWHKQLHRIGKAFNEPIEKLKKSNFTGVSVIRAFGNSEDIIDFYRKEQIKQYQFGRLRTSIHHFFGNFDALYNQGKRMLILMAVMSQRGPGQAVLLLMVLDQFQQFEGRINHVTHKYTEQQEKLQKVQRLFDFEHMEQENYEETTEVPESWPQKGEVVFNNMTVRYRPNCERVFEDISFKIEPGMKVGVVGRTGAGKSTTALTIARILELEEGSIVIDGIDIAKVGLERLRRQVTMIPQDPVLFKNTLRFNIDPTEVYSDEVLLELVKKAGLDELINKQGSEIENVLDYEIQEAGGNLSSGQKQLICICRAVLRKSKVVVLDEATSNIDVITEQRILKLLSEELKDSTVITIAHRLNTIIKSDRVVLLGKTEEALATNECPPSSLLEYDSPKNLIAQQGSHFGQLVRDLEKE